jgi:hypothetical protein
VRREELRRLLDPCFGIVPIASLNRAARVLRLEDVDDAKAVFTLARHVDEETIERKVWRRFEPRLPFVRLWTTSSYYPCVRLGTRGTAMISMSYLPDAWPRR